MHFSTTDGKERDIPEMSPNCDMDSGGNCKYLVPVLQNTDTEFIFCELHYVANGWVLHHTKPTWGLVITGTGPAKTEYLHCELHYAGDRGKRWFLSELTQPSSNEYSIWRKA